MTPLLYDPPDLSQIAGRGDPPVSEWPGVPVGRKSIMEAVGDPRDWFRYGHRLEAAELAWHEWADARSRRRRFDSDFSWNQVLIIGDYGAGKTTLGVLTALAAFRRGHAVFSNASCLIGWHLEHEEMYTAMAYMPANSFLLIDESSAALASRVSSGVAITSFNEMNLNTRKRNCFVIYMSAQDWEIASSVRRSCKEVWMPVPQSDIEVDDSLSPAGVSLSPAENPDNFRVAYHVWDDFPYRKANIIEGKVDQQGFGPPTYTMFVEGEDVRNAYLLTDTFEPAAAGAATIADRDLVKESLRRFRDGAGPLRHGQTNGDVDIETKLLMFFLEHQDDPPRFFTAGQIGHALDIHPSRAGQLVTTLLPGIRQVKRFGYPADEIYDYIRQS